MNKEIVAKELVMIAEELVAGQSILEKQEQEDYSKFLKELAKISKKYGVVIKSVGGVELGVVDSISYEDDISSGDLMPRVRWMVEMGMEGK